MFYYLLRPFIKFYSLAFFKKIYLSGLDQLPSDRPLILACNHPTAFTEPAMIGSLTLKAQNFLLRGDLFGKGKFMEFFLRSIKCIPIYRFQDGFAAMKKNEEILQYCYDLLGKGENIFILAEGVSKYERRMRPIQKGTARMAFGAYEKHKRKDITIIPIGINYTDALSFRSVIYAEVGPPIPMEDFLEDHTKNPRRAIKKLTDRLSKEIRKLVIHVEKETDEELGEQLILIEENSVKEKAFPRLSYQASRQGKIWEKIERVNQLEATEKTALQQTATLYFSKLKEWGVQDVGIAQKWYYNFWTLLTLLISLPAFLLGIIGNILPVKIGKYFAEKAANTPKFNTSLRLMFVIFAYIIYLFLLLLFVIIIGDKWLWIGLLFLPFFGYFSLHWLDFFKLWNEGRKATSLSPEQLSELEVLRDKLAKF